MRRRTNQGQVLDSNFGDYFIPREAYSEETDTLMRSEESSEEERKMPARGEYDDPNLAQTRSQDTTSFLSE